MFESLLQPIKNMGIASEKRLLYSNLLHEFFNLRKIRYQCCQHFDLIPILSQMSFCNLAELVTLLLNCQVVSQFFLDL